jgi:hypothetical protein
MEHAKEQGSCCGRLWHVRIWKVSSICPQLHTAEEANVVNFPYSMQHATNQWLKWQLSCRLRFLPLLAECACQTGRGTPASSSWGGAFTPVGKALPPSDWWIGPLEAIYSLNRWLWLFTFFSWVFSWASLVRQMFCRIIKYGYFDSDLMFQ